jgi:hypothetical protein
MMTEDVVVIFTILLLDEQIYYQTALLICYPRLAVTAYLSNILLHHRRDVVLVICQSREEAEVAILG